MKKQLIAIVLGSVFILSSNNAFSYLKTNVKENQKPTKQKDASQVRSANCSPATGKITMSFNDVSAFLETGGSMWQDRGNGVAAYEIPKGSGLKVIYAGALWMGGTDVNGQLKIAALTFRSDEDFWAGPLSVGSNNGSTGLGIGTYNPSDPVGDDAIRDFGSATIDQDQCEAYDKFYTVRKSEIIQFSTWWDCGAGVLPPESCTDVSAPSSEIMNRLYSWPAHGDASRYQDYFLAPFYDNPNGPAGADLSYNVEDGDYPWYDDILGKDDVECGFDRRITLFGDETHWWVFNDVGNIHGETNGEPIGMEIRAQAFSFATNDEVNRMTFYNYELINRGTQTLFDTYFSQYIDADIGYFSDDFAGCDVSRGLGYMYNGDNFDEDNGGNLGYGENPPSVGCDFFEGPYQDADGRDNVGPYFDDVLGVDVIPTVNEAISDTGIVYNGIGIGYSDGLIDNERFGMRRFTYYTNGAQFPYSDPNNANEFYNFMQGVWADGSEMFYGGTGAVGTPGITITPSDYLFPGDSDPLNWGTQGTDLGFDWSEIDTDGAGNSNVAGDRRFVQSAGPFTLKPGAVNNITIGIVYGRASDGDAFASVESMRRADTKAQALFDSCFEILEPPYAPKLIVQELENELVLTLSNPGTSNNFQEAYKKEDKINIVDPNLDRFYTFEGYQIYQLIDEDASISDVLDQNKSRLVFQCDIENDIIDMDNFIFDEALGFAIGSQMVDANNAGIQHSFLVKEDAFAQGDKNLVNHKRYHFIAIAYAHNEYSPYDPNDPLLLDGQKKPYISSRIAHDGAAIASVEAIPHAPIAESNGLTQNSSYGDGPIITRLDGHGNGGNAIDLTQTSINSIVSTGYEINPSYQAGRGPINVKVVDPLNVVDGYFVCKFQDYTTTASNAVSDTASWVIHRYESQGGALIDSVTSDLAIGKANEQIIPDWGVSVQINQIEYHISSENGVAASQAEVTDLLEATLSFADSSKRWLRGVTDNDIMYPTNWIRSGTFSPDTDAGISGLQCNDDPDVANFLETCAYPDEIGYDDDKKWAKILGGSVAPHKIVGYQDEYMPLAYYNLSSPTQARQHASIKYLPSVDIVMTSDKSKWTYCPIIELGRVPAFNVGNAEPGEMRKSPSVDKNGNNDGTGNTGMGWFPGYAIDVESGARLYMSFGENSFLAIDNGADMKWNPTERVSDANGNPILGGMHPVYIYNYQKKSINNHFQGNDYPAYVPSDAENLATNQLYNDMLLIEANNNSQKTKTYGNISWIVYPLATGTFSGFGAELLSTEATISLRVNKEYKDFYTAGDVNGGPNNGRPMYSWSMDDLATEIGSQVRLSEVLDMINIVPNPYYAYSQYEDNRLDTRVKITNLPEVCTVKIYSSNGKLVRTFKKDSPRTSLDWDLNNSKGIPVAGGIYLIHVDVPDIGEVIIKFFGGMRQIDLQGI